jgi:thiazole synthase
MEDALNLTGKKFHSRLLLGTGKYASLDQTVAALEAAGAEIITVAIRRLQVSKREPSLLDVIDPKQYTILPNTAGCFTAKDAVHTARLAREMGLGNWIKLEVLGDQATLYPDNEGLLQATRELVADGFQVFPYFNDDPVMAKKLVDLGCVAVMPLAAPIGSGLGLLNPYNIARILEAVQVPVIVDAGVGTASDATMTMELGVAAILMNTGIAQAKDPPRMARAMALAVESGRLAYLAGRMPKRSHAAASSPIVGLPLGGT